MLVVLRDDADLAKALVPQASPAPRQDHTGAASRKRSRLLAVLADRGQPAGGTPSSFTAGLPERAVPRNRGGGLWRPVPGPVGGPHGRGGRGRSVDKGLKASPGHQSHAVHRELAPWRWPLGQADEAVAAADEAVKLADDRNRLALRLTCVASAAPRPTATTAPWPSARPCSRNTPSRARSTTSATSLSNVYSAARELRQGRGAASLDPRRPTRNDATANNDLGYILADQGKNLEEAEDLIRKAIELDRERKKTAAGVGRRTTRTTPPTWTASAGCCSAAAGRKPAQGAGEGGGPAGGGG